MSTFLETTPLGALLIFVVSCLLASSLLFYWYRRDRIAHQTSVTTKSATDLHVAKVQPQGTASSLYPCGHEGPTSFVLQLYGRTFPASKAFSTTSERCPDCVLKMFLKDSIRCALCGITILPGEPVAKYSSCDNGVQQKWRKGHPKDVAVGCMDWDCCESGAFFSGHWSEEGRIISAFGESLNLGQSVLAEGDAIMVKFHQDGTYDVTKLPKKGGKA